MKNKDYLNDLIEIKSIMNRSTRFMSLSGISGIMAGLYAIVGGWIAYQQLGLYRNNPNGIHTDSIQTIEISLIGIALLVAILSIVTAYYFTKIEAQKNNEKMWTTATRQMLMSFALPLITGGIFILALTLKNYHELIAPSALIFYGLALVNASKHTLSSVKHLGILEIILGLLAMLFIGNGLLFWFIGFGILHIIYGSLIYLKTGK